MGLLGNFRILWYTTLSLSFLYIAISPVLNALGLQPLNILVKGDIELLLILSATILVAAIGIIFLSGLLILTGWKANPKLPRATRLPLALVLGFLAFLMSGALGLVIPIPIIPLILAGLLIWSVLRFASIQLVQERDMALHVDEAEELAVKFWRSRNPGSSKPIPVGALMDGNRWIITLSSTEKTGQLDIDARTGIVTGWSQSS